MEESEPWRVPMKRDITIKDDSVKDGSSIRAITVRFKEERADMPTGIFP